MARGLWTVVARALPVAAACICTGAAAYTTQDLQRDARVHHAKMMASLGGVLITQSTTFTAGQAAGTQRLWLRGERWRSEGATTVGGGAQGSIQATTLFDGKDLWTLTMGMKVKLPGGQTSGQAQAPFTSAWSNLPEGTEVIGSDKIGGRDCWRLRHPELPANRALHVGRTELCIDKKQFILLMSESVLSRRVVRTTMSDLRTIRGYEFPHLMTTTSDGKTTMTTKITQLEVGAAFSDDLFDAAKLTGAPAGARTPGGFDVEAQVRRAEEMRRRMGMPASAGK